MNYKPVATIDVTNLSEKERKFLRQTLRFQGKLHSIAIPPESYWEDWMKAIEEGFSTLIVREDIPSWCEARLLEKFPRGNLDNIQDKSDLPKLYVLSKDTEGNPTFR